MDIAIHASFLPHDDPDASLAFYRDGVTCTPTDSPSGRNLAGTRTVRQGSATPATC